MPQFETTGPTTEISGLEPLLSVATRTAMRALPYGIADQPEPHFVLHLFRANAISFAARNGQTHAMFSAVYAATKLFDDFAAIDDDRIDLPLSNNSKSLAAAGSAAGSAAEANARFASNLPNTSDDLTSAYQRDLIMVAGLDQIFEALRATTDAAAQSNTQNADAFYAAEKDDSDWIESKADQVAGTMRIIRKPLWLTMEPTNFKATWESGVARILAANPSFSVWIDWYERRIRGERAAFDIPGDKGRKEDKAILIRLAEATNEEFWDKGATFVNPTLQSWIEEARARVATDLPVHTLAPAIPAQNPNALSFRRGETGRIAIDASAAVDELRKDEDAVDRHTEAVVEARAVLERCRGNNVAARFTVRLENYLDAAGENIEDTRPSMLVQRGEKLRQEIAAYNDPYAMLDPIADDILIDMKSWQSAHNMLVGLDPVLVALDRAILGPERQPTLIPPDEIKAIVLEADQAEILEDGVAEPVTEAAELAPIVPDPTDRRTIWSVESIQNLIIEAFAIAINHPKTSAGAILATGVATQSTVCGGGGSGKQRLCRLQVSAVHCGPS